MTAPTTSYHLRPRSGWLNDPNGMARVDGVWHVFFQHNPHAPVHDRIAWGHATSRDLAHWELQPVAFSPSPGAPDAFGCWTGVFVPGHDRPAVVYSGIADDSRQSTICLRWGSADLRDWGAPIVVGRTPRQDGIAIMRDPFVFEHDGRRLAVLGVGLADGAPAIALFDRSDELSWRYEGILLADDPVLAAVGRADVWECPQLFPLDGRWVLIVSLYNRGVLGNVVAAVGDLVDEGGSLRFVAERAHVVDEGADFYSPQVVADDDARGWKIARFVPEARNLDITNADELRQAMRMARSLHTSGRRLERDFDYIQEALHYERLVERHHPIDLPDYVELRTKVMRLKVHTDADGFERVPSHNDFFPPNFLVAADGHIDLIDWEYAGMSDVASDFGTLVVCTRMSVERADEAIGYYFDRTPTTHERRHFWSYVVFAGWCWYVWALAKEAEGDDAGQDVFTYYRHVTDYVDALLSWYEDSEDAAPEIFTQG